MHIAERDEAAHQQAGGDEQSERDGDFEHDNCIAQPAVSCATAGAFAAITQRIVQVAAHNLKRGREPKNNGGEDRTGQRESEHGKVQADDRFGRNDSRRYECHETFESTPSHNSAENRAAGGEQEAFDEELANDAPASGAERGANGELFFARSSAGKKQIGYIAAADKEQKTNGGQDDVQGGSELTNDQIGQRFDVNAEIFGIVLGIYLGEILGNHGEVGFRLPDGDTWFEVPQQEPKLRKPVAGWGGGPARLLGDPHVRIAPSEAWRHDADKRTLRSIKDKGLVDDRGIGAEPRHPGFVAHDKHRRRTGFIVSGLSDAAEQRGNAQKLKGAGGDEAAIKAFGTLAGAVKDIEAIVGDDTVEDMILFDIVEEFGTGIAAAAAGFVALGVMDLDRNKAGGICVWERLHQDIFDDTENGGGGANAEREGDGGNDCETATLAQVAQGEAYVLAECAHETLPRRSDA